MMMMIQMVTCFFSVQFLASKKKLLLLLLLDWVGVFRLFISGLLFLNMTTHNMCFEIYIDMSPFLLLYHIHLNFLITSAGVIRFCFFVFFYCYWMLGQKWYTCQSLSLSLSLPILFCPFFIQCENQYMWHTREYFYILFSFVN